MQYVKPATESEPQIGIVVKTEPLLGVANFFTVNRAGGGATLMKCVPFDQLTPIPAVKYVEGIESEGSSLCLTLALDSTHQASF